LAEKLSTGAVGAEVARLHELLHRLNFEVPAAEVQRRFFGPGTRAAMLACQRKHRLACSGEVDGPTAALLNTNPPPPAGGIIRHGVSAASRAMPPETAPLVAPDIADIPDAPVVDSNPLALPASLHSLLEQLGQAALGAPDNFGQLLDQLPKPGDVQPDNPLDALKQFKRDWWSLLVFLLVEIQDRIGDPRVWVAAQQPDGWARMVTLNYSPDAVAKQPPPPPVLTVGLAVRGPNDKTDWKQGVWVNVAKSFADTQQLGSDSVTLNLSGTGPGSWSYTFGGGPSPLLPDGSADTVRALVTWNPWGKGLSLPLISLTPGPVTADLTLHAASPMYAFTFGLGPLSAGLQKQGGPLGTLMSQVLEVSPVEYHPQVALTDGQSPEFSLGG
jgi:hypothetical protein